jgi:hypothetical protein
MIEASIIWLKKSGFSMSLFKNNVYFILLQVSLMANAPGVYIKNKYSKDLNVCEKSP